MAQVGRHRRASGARPPRLGQGVAQELPGGQTGGRGTSGDPCAQSWLCGGREPRSAHQPEPKAWGSGRGAVPGAVPASASPAVEGLPPAPRKGTPEAGWECPGLLPPRGRGAGGGQWLLREKHHCVRLAHRQRRVCSPVPGAGGSGKASWEEGINKERNSQKYFHARCCIGSRAFPFRCGLRCLTASWLQNARK